ncbi:MAG: GNAT family N-acetyltransferase [Actinobacteria bacterium]|nr:GNAT family N-acetyltransferase [Actinomycetota bacterium]
MRPHETEATVRPARAEDERAIHLLHAGCFHDLFAGLLGDYRPSSEHSAERERSWTGPIGSPRGRHALLVAERRKRVIGFVAVGPTRDADNDAQTTGELRTVMIDDNARGSGVGSALMAAGERAMRDQGLRIATLWVVPQNWRAVRCYERCGWRPDGTERLMDVGGHNIWAIRYRKPLAPETTATPPRHASSHRTASEDLGSTV